MLKSPGTSGARSRTVQAANTTMPATHNHE